VRLRLGRKGITLMVEETAVVVVSPACLL
jgi:hypothetical protein